MNRATQPPYVILDPARQEDLQTRFRMWRVRQAVKSAGVTAEGLARIDRAMSGPALNYTEIYRRAEWEMRQLLPNQDPCLTVSIFKGEVGHNPESKEMIDQYLTWRDRAFESYLANVQALPPPPPSKTSI